MTNQAITPDVHIFTVFRKCGLGGAQRMASRPSTNSIADRLAIWGARRNGTAGKALMASLKLKQKSPLRRAGFSDAL